MTDWKRFEDELPTEDLPVLYYPIARCAGYPYSISNPTYARLHWKRDGWTHWAYIVHAPGAEEFMAHVCDGCNCHDPAPEDDSDFRNLSEGC